MVQIRKSPFLIPPTSPNPQPAIQVPSRKPPNSTPKVHPAGLQISGPLQVPHNHRLGGAAVHADDHGDTSSFATRVKTDPVQHITSRNAGAGARAACSGKRHQKHVQKQQAGWALRGLPHAPWCYRINLLVFPSCDRGKLVQG